MFENNSSDEETDDDEGHLFQSQFPIHDLCDARVHFEGNGGGVGVAGENLERLRKALTFPKKKKKNDGEEGGGGGGEDDGDDDEEEGEDGDEEEDSDDEKDFDPDAEEEEEEGEEEEEDGDDDDKNENNAGNDEGDDAAAEEQFNTNLKHALNRRDEDGQTALHCAILSGQNLMVEMLLEKGADPFATLEGSPPVHVACTMASFAKFREASLEMVKVLLPHLTRHDVEDDYHRTAMSIAAQHGSKEICAYLIQNYEAPNEEDDLKAYLNQKDRSGRTALIWAANYNRADVVELLLENDSSMLNDTDTDGNTALIHAVRNNSAECVKVLIKRNADADIVNAKEESAKCIAKRRGYDDLVSLLNGKKGKKETTPPGVNGLIIAPDACLLHHSCPAIKRGCSFDVPTENVQRLTCIMNPVNGTLRAADFSESSTLSIDTTESPAQMVDVLRCHEYNYIKKVQKICESLPDVTVHSSAIGTIDGDTTVCSHSFHAALCAAGAAIKAVDAVVIGEEHEKCQRVFCAVRPPGHHAGPLGPVGLPGDPIGQGSHGFCLINNVAVAAAYARCVHRHKGIKKVAIIDFDVHHGNGTEALVANTAPSAPKVKISTPWSSGEITTNTCKPWMDPDTDKDEIFFASVHGYGRMSNFYPGTGPTKDTKQRQEQNDINFENEDNNNNTSTENDNTDTGYVSGYSSAGVAAAGGVVKDDQKVLAEMETATFEKPPPRIVDVGMIGEGKRAERGSSWRRVWRAKVLPALDEFKPDLVFISAGFDAHSKDAIQGPVNLGVKELDYEWLTNELCEIANKHAGGRVISVLEGGYRIQGKAVSAFGRSVASHCKALFATHNTDCFDEKLNARILEKEVAKKREQRELVRLERLERETEQLRRRQEERERELLRLQELEENGGVETEEGGAPTEAAEAAAPPPAEVQEVGGKRRRRGGAVDYAALNAKMLEEQQQEQKQKEEEVEEQDPPAVPIVIDDDDEENENVDEENMEEDDEEDDMDAEEEDEEELADA